MYVSQLFAANFRSLKQVLVRFSAGKNVIVGKNNCGKSNIIKALDVLVGEKFPTFVNITDNDFYTYEQLDEDTGEIMEVVANEFYLEATLMGRDVNRELLMSIKKQTAFSKLHSPKDLYFKEGDIFKINYDLFQNLDDLENRQEIEILEAYSSGKVKKTDWKTPDRLFEFISSATTLKVFFCKSRLDEEKSGFGLIVRDTMGGLWISHFLSKKLRDSLLTTTVIGALRSHKDELRLVHYTWFGKLMAGIWNKNKARIDAVSGKPYESLIAESVAYIKGQVDTLFAENTTSIRTVLEGAIAHKEISFKLMDDSNNELYKNIRVFVNDGIDRPIHEKGTGIQSAIIIALFSLYCNDFHTNSSLLMVEEPELYLHPQARRVISAELNKFLKGSKTQERQLIISTHSTEYLKGVDPMHITRVYKDNVANCSVAKQLDEKTSGLISLELKRFLWAHNSELFFADKVILVEGGEVFLISAIVDKLKVASQVLDYENISVARVNGKGSFSVYLKMLDCFGISYVILGDLDCFKDEVLKLVTYLKIENLIEPVTHVKEILSKMDVAWPRIYDRVKDIEKNYDAQQLFEVFKGFQEGTIKVDDEALLATLSFMQNRYVKGNKVEYILSKIEPETFNEVLGNLQDHNIFIWSKGELEDYYTDRTKQLTGSKDMKALRLSYILQDPETKIEDYLKHIDEITALCRCILKK